MRALAFATFIVVAALIPLGSSTSAFGQFASLFEKSSHDFGTVARAAKTEHRFYFENPYNETIHVRSVRTSCGCTTPVVETKEVAPRERGSILAIFNTSTHTGNRAATLTVTFDRPRYGEVQLHVKGYVRTDVVFNPGEASFGSVDQGVAKSVDVVLDYAGRSDWHIKGLNTSDRFVTATAQETSRTNGRVRYNLKITLSEEAPAGPLQSELIVLTNDRNLTRVPLRIDANVVPGLTVSPTTLSLGDISTEDSHKQLVLLKGQQPFKITGVTSDVLNVEVNLSEEAKTMHPVQLVVTPKDGEIGTEIKGTVVLKTDLQDKPEIELVVIYRLNAPPEN